MKFNKQINNNKKIKLLKKMFFFQLKILNLEINNKKNIKNIKNIEEKIQEIYNNVSSQFDKLYKKNIIKKNKNIRLKSKFHKIIYKIKQIVNINS